MSGGRPEPAESSPLGNFLFGGDCLVVSEFFFYFFIFFQRAEQFPALTFFFWTAGLERLGHTQEAGGGKFRAINLMDCNPAPASSRSSLG